MEIAVIKNMPTYSGGLGVLAGDTIRAAADLRIPMVAITLLHRRGYFHQELTPDGVQIETPMEWQVKELLTETNARAMVTIEGRPVIIRALKYEIAGQSGFTVPVYFLDTDLPENEESDRTLTHHLYGGDDKYRLSQEIILGSGGVKILRELGHPQIEKFHLNEGHSSFLTLELMQEILKKRDPGLSPDPIASVRERCVFTTHTPVAAGHDKFSLDIVSRVYEHYDIIRQFEQITCFEGKLNMTYLALNLSGYVNGVAKRHGEVSRLMFTGYSIDSITNGVHAGTWASGYFQELYDHYIPGWKESALTLRYAMSIPGQNVWKMHIRAKEQLLDTVRARTGISMDRSVFTIGFARRATVYKRADLIFNDIERLKDISQRAGQFQIIFAGKAHPRDEGGKEIIRRLFEAARVLGQHVKVAYLENYDMELGRLVTSGVDLWLNTPRPPQEASGTSGMKAAINGVPSLSILDGWWIEGCLEGITGWSIGDHEPGREVDNERDAASLYDKLENIIIPLFYHQRDRYVQVMKNAIAINGSFFNTHRMIHEYVLKAYFR